MSELMALVVLPTSNAVLYVGSRTPENEGEWNDLQGQALMLAEAANLMMTPAYAREGELWAEDSALMLDAAKKAYRGAMEQDADALAALNDPLYTSCIKCHEDFEVVY